MSSSKGTATKPATGGSNTKAKEKTKSNPTANTDPLYVQYPVNSVVELTLQGGETVRGLVYCTDEVSHTVVLKKSLIHTTLSSEIRLINASCIEQTQIIHAVAPDKPTEGGGEVVAEELAIPLSNVQRKVLEEREKRALRLAEERFRHINEKATPEGQAVFDRLLKACGEVVWKGESILVLNQIQVNPPYTTDDCKLLPSNHSLSEGSLERVKKIVSAPSAIVD